MAAYPAVAAWLERVAATPGAIDDLAPYPAAAHAGGRVDEASVTARLR